MRTCQPLLTPPPLYVYTYILYLDCQVRFSSFTYKIFSMKKYLTSGNILRALTILMLIYYFNHEGMTNVHQIIDTIKSLFK
jgi:hypothetical protein